MISVDINSMIEKLLILAIGGVFTWTISSIIKLKVDLNNAFFKIRSLEKENAKDSH